MKPFLASSNPLYDYILYETNVDMILNGICIMNTDLKKKTHENV